jgi:hypothetical protein
MTILARYTNLGELQLSSGEIVERHPTVATFEVMPTAVTNLILNPNASQGLDYIVLTGLPTGYTLAAATSLPAGTNFRNGVSVNVTATGDNNVTWINNTTSEPHSIPVSANTTYTFSVWVYSANGLGFGIRPIEWTSAGYAAVDDGESQQYTTAGSWQRITRTITTTATTAYVSFRVYVGFSTGSGYVTGAMIETGSVAHTFVEGSVPAGSILLEGEIVEENILKHTAASNGTTDNNYAYRDIWHGSYTPVAGDILVIDQYEPSSNPQLFNIGFDGSVTGNTNSYGSLRGFVGLSDQDGHGTNAAGLSNGATNGWYHREFQIGSVFAAHGGGTITAFNVDFEGDTGGTYTAYYRKFYILDANRRIKIAIFDGSIQYSLPIASSGAGINNYTGDTVTTIATSSLSSSLVSVLDGNLLLGGAYEEGVSLT